MAAALKELLKSVRLCQSYPKSKTGSFFVAHSLCLFQFGTLGMYTIWMFFFCLGILVVFIHVAELAQLYYSCTRDMLMH